MNRKSFRINHPGGFHLQKLRDNGFCIVTDVNSLLQDLLVQTGLGPITYVILLYMRTSPNCTYKLLVGKWVRWESCEKSCRGEQIFVSANVCVNGHRQCRSFSITFSILRMPTIARLLGKYLGLKCFPTAGLTR